MRPTLPVETSERDATAASPLLRTKLYIPGWRPGLVARERLVERLERGAESKLVIVSAPAGFGKTTLVAEWLASTPADERRAAWLSLEQSDNHPATFWTYLIAALQTVEPEVGADVIALFESPRPPPIESLLTGLLNELGASSRDLVLVLDDYHLIDSSAIHEGMAYLLDHLPPSMHLVITGRADPQLPLARLRGRGEVAEIRAVDLRFTVDEAAAFLNEAMGLDLAARDVAVLDVRTEGWIAGLQLAALSMQGRDDVAGFIAAFTGDDRYIVDYLVEEVLERQPTDVRQFLLQTSILDRLTGSLCDAVTRQVGGRGVLEGLERDNLFVVPLDDKRQWYRYHRLFADVLHAHLLEEQPEEIPDLHRRASVWYEHHGLTSEAIRHALAANDIVRAAGLVELAAETYVRRHQPDRLIEWLKPIPDDLIRTMPVLSTFYALALQGVGEIKAATSRLDDAERCLDAAGTTEATAARLPAMVVVDKAAFEDLPSRILLARSYAAMASGDVSATIELARSALDLLPDDEYHWRGAAASLLGLAHWATGDLETAHRFHAEGVASLERTGDIVLALSAAYHDADLLKARGRLAEAGARYEQSLRLASEHGHAAIPGVANLHFGLSELVCEQGDLGGATQHLRQGEELGNSAALPATPFRLRLAKARLRRSLGDLDGALKVLDEAERLHLRSAVPDIRPVAGLKVRVKIAQGRIAEALDWTRAEGLSVDDDVDYPREFLHITLARALIAQATRERDSHSLRGADQLLERLHQAATVGGRMASVIEILVLRALLEHASDNTPRAVEHLAGALALAEPEGYVRTFVDEGEPMRELLQHAIASGVGASYSQRLLAAFGEQSGLVASAAGTRVRGLAEPLTPRELEILRLIAAGMMNQEIADHLVISVSTVKRHIANGYGKLGVGHRTEAVARANELGLF